MKGEEIMLVTHELRSWLFKAKENWELAAKENGDQAGDWGCEVFSDIFKCLIKAIAALELPISRPGKYVCDIGSGSGDALQIIWFEPPAGGCFYQSYVVCNLTLVDVGGAVDFEQLWRLFIIKFNQGLADSVKKMAVEIATCEKRIKNCVEAQTRLRYL